MRRRRRTARRRSPRAARRRSSSPPLHSGRPPAEHERAAARELILAHGWNSTAYQILNPGFDLWFSRSRPAVVGYVAAPLRRVVGGAPVCAESDLGEVAAEFERDARAAGRGVVYFGAEGRLESLHRTSQRHASLLLGAQPAWTPSAWDGIVRRRASLRAQLNRARNKGVTVTLWDSGRAEHHPALDRVLHEWLATRGLPPLHFLIEPDTLGDLGDRRVFVAERGAAPVGFLVASPVPARDGWLTEQFVRGTRAPNGTAELMIDAAMRWMAESGCSYATLGLAPLSRRAQGEPPAPWLRALLAWVRAHGRRFYNFDGLDAFKAKLAPERWEPVYAIATESHFSPVSLWAIASAFTGGHPLATIARGIAHAAAAELRRAARA